MPVCVRLRRAPLQAPSSALPRRPTMDSRIADLVADMSHKEVEDMVAELERDEERRQVWSVWKSIHARHEDKGQSGLKSDVGDDRRSRGAGLGPKETIQEPGPDLAQTMRMHDREVDSLLKAEESRLEKRAAKARREAARREKLAPENAYRGARAVHKSAGARRAGFRTKVKVEAPSRDLDVIRDVERLNEADKLKGNTFGARGSKRSGSKEPKVEGLRASTLKANRKVKIDLGGL